MKKCNSEEKRLVDILLDRGTTVVGVLDRALVESLYVKNLVYLSVPMRDNDMIVVPPLEGFVMNRVLHISDAAFMTFCTLDEPVAVYTCCSWETDAMSLLVVGTRRLL